MNTLINTTLDSVSAVLNPESAVENILAKNKVDVVSRETTVRNGIAFIFELRASGVTYVHAARRTSPHGTALFQVADRCAARAWIENGIVPPGETTRLLSLLEAGACPPQLATGPVTRFQN